jgi:WD40 repeat protein
MVVLEAGDMVSHLQFLPDSRRLLVVLASPNGPAALEVWTVPGGERVRFRLPALDPQEWNRMQYGPWTAIHPSGEWCYIAWNGRLYSFDTADGTPRRLPGKVKAHQVVVSPDGDRVVAAHAEEIEKHLCTFRTEPTDSIVSRYTMPLGFQFLAGFLPDGERLVTIEGAVRIGTPHKDYDFKSVRGTSPCRGNRPRISPDGRYLAVLGYSSMYLYDLPALGKPRQIKASTNFGDFRSLAFHPDGKTMAMIHGGPTLVKVYDLATLRLKDKYQWKVGQLDSVAYSPDGLLAAAGGREGKVVVWDVEG